MQKAMVDGTAVLVQGQVTQQAARIVDSGHTVQRFKAAPPFWAVWTVKMDANAWIVIKEDVPR